jgi:cytoskeletal protein CcmA (bactofilin family)
MQSLSIIGRSVTITGDVTADEPLTIAGRVVGTVSIAGHSLTIEETGQVDADLQADAVMVSGQVTGAVAATTRIVIKATAVVDGKLSAPVLGIEDGANICGTLDIQGIKTPAALKIAS